MFVFLKNASFENPGCPDHQSWYGLSNMIIRYRYAASLRFAALSSPLSLLAVLFHVPPDDYLYRIVAGLSLLLPRLCPAHSFPAIVLGWVET